MPGSFVHLHLHSEYSLVNGMIRLPALVEQTLQNQMPAVAITDMGNLYGAVKFFNRCVGQGIKPIIGAEVYLENPDKVTQPYILVLLVQNEVGYVHLSELLSRGFREGQAHGRPILQKEWLQGKTDGLICLSGGLRGEIGGALMAGRADYSEQLIAEYQASFPGRFYLEIQRVGRSYEEEYIAAVAQLAERFQIPLVATNDAHFMQESDFDAHEVRVCINEGRALNDPRRAKHHTPQQYYKSAPEMVELFADIPSAIHNTLRIAQRCNFVMRMGEYFLPDFPVPDGETIESHLRNESYNGLDAVLRRRFPDGPDEATLREYHARMDFELKIINEMGFPGYFLIVADFIQWAKENGVPVGPGRGSGAGSIIAYVLKITDLDPIEHVLLFERFLNPERVSMPDFDVDFCIEGRERVIEYVAQKYGREKVSQIITYGTMAAKGVVRDVGRVMGMSYGHVDGVAKLIPFDLGITLTKALEQEPELKDRYDNEEEITELIDMALKLEGLARNVGKHAGGVVIAPTNLTDFTPLYCEHGSDQIVSQYDKDDLETVGLVKFDFLGLKTLTIIDWAVKAINVYREQRDEAPVDITQLPLDDQKTYEILRKGLTTAIFQLESSGMKELIKNLKPDQFEDIVALVALYRPGPLGAGMEKVYCDRKHGKEATKYAHPMLEPILENTQGIILYQEQVMEIAQVMAGYSLGGADILRRAMGKKKPEEMAKQRAIFEQGADERNVPPEVAKEVFDLMEYFAAYGFNKSHSAAYALIAYQTAWLKAHYPSQFMAACMSADMENTDKVVILLNEANEMGLTVQHPDINLCQYDFRATDEKHIVYGLGAIKGIGKPVIEAIISARDAGGRFSDLYDLCARVDVKRVNRRALEALIRAGALDELGVHRASLIESVDLALDAANQQHRSALAGQNDMFGIAAPAETVQTYQQVPEWKEEDLLAAEKDTLGLYLSGHPIDMYIQELDQFTSSRLVDLDVAQGKGKKSVTLAGLVIGARTMNTKSGSKMAFLQLDDKTARVEVGVFGELYDQRRDVIHKDKVLVVKGKASYDHFSGGIRLSAEELFDIEQARSNLARHMQIHIRSDQLHGNVVKDLRQILEPQEEGQCGVGFQYQTETGVCQLDVAHGWRVIPNKVMLERLESLVGQKNIRLIY
ncbi:DNA polymerase III subunit alpha [Arenicella xantha]|uniref:DNA polymerase III subunit alpha n=1 Tax=Arenicella xantha TaxID=644221 RepID=A0A395JKH5_9GAMM|nr:DNA polymerase III subunit alpha [Arenicella xantha]RBP50935.1 DNA polymerase III alpha subunit [Arenicella xantha]